MLSMRRALLSLRPQARRGLLRAGRQLAPAAAPSRGFASAHSSAQTPSKWPKRLLIGVAALAAINYLRKETPESKERRRLLALGNDAVKRGDMDQAARYFSQSFAAIKDVLTPEATMKTACLYAALCESVDQHEAALPFYQTAMKNLKTVNPISVRCVDGVRLMDRMGQCYHRLGRHETAEKLFKKAIHLYEKYHGEFSNKSTSSRQSDQVIAALDGSVSNVFLHYAQLMASLEKDSEVSFMRQRLVDLVRSSPSMRSRESKTLDQFDDLMALHAIREERQRERGEGHPTPFY